jgi:hypothetical protein
VSVIFIVMPYFLFMFKIGSSMVLRYWSVMDMSESFSLLASHSKTA